MAIVSIMSRPFILTSKNIMLITTDVVAVLSLFLFLLIHLLDENTFGVTILERDKYLYIGNSLLCIILTSLAVSMVTGVYEVIRSVTTAFKKFFHEKKGKKTAKKNNGKGAGRRHGRGTKFIKNHPCRPRESLRRKKQDRKAKKSKNGVSESGMELRDRSRIDDSENHNDAEIIIQDFVEQSKLPI